MELATVEPANAIQDTLANTVDAPCGTPTVAKNREEVIRFACKKNRRPSEDQHANVDKDGRSLKIAAAVPRRRINVRTLLANRSAMGMGIANATNVNAKMDSQVTIVRKKGVWMRTPKRATGLPHASF